MNRGMLGGLIGVFLGFCGFIVVGVFSLQESHLTSLFWPTHFLITAANNKGYGPAGLMVWRTLAYLSNLALFGIIGFAIDLLIPRRTAP